MANEIPFVSNVVAIANATAIIKKSMQKVGLEYICPLDEAVQNEKISKAILRNLRDVQEK